MTRIKWGRIITWYAEADEIREVMARARLLNARERGTGRVLCQSGVVIGDWR